MVHRQLLLAKATASAGFLATLALIWTPRAIYKHLPGRFGPEQYVGHTFNVAKECKSVHLGPEATSQCGGPWSAPCFNRSACVVDTRSRSHGDHKMDSGSVAYAMSVYVHDTWCSLRNSSSILRNPFDGNPTEYENMRDNAVTAKALRKELLRRGRLAETPEEACVIVFPVPYAPHPCISKTPTWRGGQNHVMFDLHDHTRNRRPDIDGLTMFAGSNMRPCYYREGHDIPVPLPAKRDFTMLRDVPAPNRKYVVTFKGTIYMSGEGHSERTAVLEVAAASNDPRVAVAVKCMETHLEHLQPHNVEFCTLAKRRFGSLDYADLMNSTFALIPAGRSPATYRLGEALSAGAIPVFIHQNFVKPFAEVIPWASCSFTFPPEEARSILPTLKAVSPQQLAEMQASALDIYDKYFGNGMDRIVSNTLDILERRLEFRE